MGKDLLVEKEGAICWFILNRPEYSNALSDDLLEDLDLGLRRVLEDESVKVVVFKAVGDDFSVGYDWHKGVADKVAPPDARDGLSYGQLLARVRRNQERWRYLCHFPRFTVAQVHGKCIGAGCHLAFACQVCIAAENSEFGEPAVQLGYVTSSPLWLWSLGIQQARELLFTGKVISGKEAERIGLIMRAAPVQELEVATRNQAERMANLALDGGVVRAEGYHAALDVMGLGSSWEHWAQLHLASCLASEFDFYPTRDLKGVDAALRMAQAPFNVS